MGRPTGLVCFGCSCWNRWRGSMLPPDLVSILTQTEAVAFTAGTCRQFDDCVCFIALLGTDVVDDHLLWVHISYYSTVNCSNKQVFVWESFLCFGFGCLWFSPLFTIYETGLMMGCLWASGVTALAFCLPVTLFPTTFACQGMSRAVVSTGRVLVGAVRAQCVGCQQFGIMCLVGMAYRMYHMSCTHCSCSWLHSVVCSADLKQVWYPLVMADLQKLFAQLNVSIWNGPNQPVLKF